MSTENDYSPWATGAGANVMSLANYQALSALSTGFEVGLADPTAVNRALRQATFVAACIATMIVNETGANALDDGNVTEFTNNLVAAIQALITAGVVFANNTQAEAGSSTSLVISPSTLAYVNGLLQTAIEQGIQRQSYTFSSDGSTAANSYNIALTPSFTTPTKGMGVSVEIGTGNTSTGASTLNVNGGTAFTIKKHSSGALADIAAGDLVAGHVYNLVFDGIYWQLMSPTG